MTNLIPVATLKNSINSVFITQGQLIYCTDTLEAFYDINNTIRVNLATTRQLNTESLRTSLLSPKTTLIYIVKETNKLYRYSEASGWIEFLTFENCTDLIYNATNLTPGVLSSGGIARAPMTITSQVYNNDGSTVEDTLNSLVNEGMQVTLEKKTEHVLIESDGQKIIDIPYPTADYDIYKYPVMVVLGDTYISPDKYALGSDQLIFNDAVAATTITNEIVTFIFAFCDINTDDGINATSVDGRGFSIGNNSPANKTDGHIWIDVDGQAMKVWDEANSRWNIIFDNNATRWEQNTVNVPNTTTYVPIGITGFDCTKDKLIVFYNSTYLNEDDYSISLDNSYISCKNGESWEVMGDGNTFTFMVFKHVSLYDYGNITPDDTVIITPEITNNFNTLTNTVNSITTMIGDLENQMTIASIAGIDYPDLVAGLSTGSTDANVQTTITNFNNMNISILALIDRVNNITNRLEIHTTSTVAVSNYSNLITQLASDSNTVVIRSLQLLDRITTMDNVVTSLTLIINDLQDDLAINIPDGLVSQEVLTKLYSLDISLANLNTITNTLQNELTINTDNPGPTVIINYTITNENVMSTISTFSSAILTLINIIDDLQNRVTVHPESYVYISSSDLIAQISVSSTSLNQLIIKINNMISVVSTLTSTIIDLQTATNMHNDIQINGATYSPTDDQSSKIDDLNNIVYNLITMVNNLQNELAELKTNAN